MKYALINPPWDYSGSIYFGCREPHLPLELGYAAALLAREGHGVLLLDAHLQGLDLDRLRDLVANFRPDFTVITTAPSYLFWRCPPPELRVPQKIARELRGIGGVLAAVGPHGSATPAAVLRKLGVEIVVRGEFEQILAHLATGARTGWRDIPGICVDTGSEILLQGLPHETDLSLLPALRWSPETIHAHSHHHHRFDSEPASPGAEIESSRGCPYRCLFCAKENFRNRYRKRPLSVVADELDGLLEHSVGYVYFVDEIFMPDADLLDLLSSRKINFGVQLRIDLWQPEMLESLGRAGCVSIEAGVESISSQGQASLGKRYGISLLQITERLVFAKKHIPFVQANLIDTGLDDPEEIELWRGELSRSGVWANKPVPMFAYPGSPAYARLWGDPDDMAWERAHSHYLQQHAGFSDIQEHHPLPLPQLEEGASP